MTRIVALIITLFLTSITQAQVAPMPNVPSVCAKVWRQKLTDAIAANMRQIDARLIAIEATQAKLDARLTALEQVEGPPAPPPPVDPPPVIVPRSVMQDGDGSIIWIYQPQIDPIPNTGTMNTAVLTEAIQRMVPVGFTGHVVFDAEHLWINTPADMIKTDSERGKCLDLLHALRPGAKGAFYGFPVTTCNELDPAFHAAALASPITLAKSDWFCPSVYDDTIGAADDLACVNKAVTFALSIAKGKPVMPAVSHRTYPGLVLIPDAELTAHVAEVFVPTVNTDKADGVCFWHSDVDYPIDAEIPAGVAKATYLKWVVDRSTCLIQQAALGSNCVPPTKPVAVVQPPPVTATKIEWTGADGLPKSITPVSASSPITINSGISPAGMTGKTWTGSMTGVMRVLSVSDGAGTDNIRLQNVNAEWREYGAWVLGGRFTFDGCNWKCVNPVTETYSIRNYAAELSVLNSTLDNSAGWKRSVRQIQGRAAFVNCTIKGGAFEIGNPDASPNKTDVPYLLVRGGSITKASDPMNMVVRVNNGAGDLVFENVDFIGGGNAFEIDSTFLGQIAIRNCRRNGQPFKASHVFNASNRPVTITSN